MGASRPVYNRDQGGAGSRGGVGGYGGDRSWREKKGSVGVDNREIIIW